MLSIQTGFDVVISLAGNVNMKDQPGMIDAAAAGELGIVILPSMVPICQYPP